jgi:hypothetical protein
MSVPAALLRAPPPKPVSRSGGILTLRAGKVGALRRKMPENAMKSPLLPRVREWLFPKASLKALVMADGISGVQTVTVDVHFSIYLNFRKTM